MTELHAYPDDEAYFADATRVSASMLKVYRRSTALYHAKYVGGTLPPETTTRALEFGSAAHAAILEPDRLGEMVAVAPYCDRRTKAGREEFAAFEREHAGKAIITGPEHDQLQRMVASVRRCSLARVLLDAADRLIECPIIWNDVETGLGCKAKPDLWLPQIGAVVDLKTATGVTAWEFARSITQFGYWLSEAHYRAGTQADRYVFLVVDKNPPFEVAVYELDRPSVERASIRWRETVNQLATTLESGDWQLQPREVTRLSLPEWI